MYPASSTGNEETKNIEQGIYLSSMTFNPYRTTTTSMKQEPHNPKDAQLKDTAVVSS